jgi:alpha-ribazole phosphatase
MNRKIYLVRHGRIDIGKEKCYIGVTDLTLSKEGITQAEKLKKFFSDIDIEKAYVSPLIRCIQTSDIILENRNVERILMKELMEINLGCWEGKSFRYIKKFFPEQFKDRGENIDTFVTPGGESFEQLKERVIPAFEAIKENSTGNVLIVAHAGVIRVILSSILSITIRDMFKINQDYGCVNEISWNDEYEKWQCEKIM